MTANNYFIRLAAIVLTFAASLAYAQQQPQLPGDYPNKTIRIITAPPGGGQDFAARIIAQALSGPLGQSVIVDNRPVNLTGEIAAKAPPDGYTLAVQGAPHWVEPLLRKTTYDPIRDFEPIAMLVNSPSILVVHPSVPVKSVKELIALSKAKPAELNYSEGGTGAPSHLAGELFKSMAEVNIVRVPYKANAAAVIAMIGGEVHLTFPSATAVTPYLKSGRLRALAVTTAKQSALFPGLPTIAETLPGYEIGSSSSMFVPARTPAVIIARLHREVVRVLNQADVQEKFLITGSEIVGSSPEQLAATMKSEMIRFGKLIKDAGIRAD